MIFNPNSRDQQKEDQDVEARLRSMKLIKREHRTKKIKVKTFEKRAMKIE